MRKEDRKFCKKRLKRMANCLKDIYPFDYAKKFTHELDM